jgi:hypothetical protein
MQYNNHLKLPWISKSDIIIFQFWVWFQICMVQKSYFAVQTSFLKDGLITGSVACLV